MLGAGPLYRLTRAPVIGVALPTSISLLLTSAGLLLERPSAGVMRVVTSRGPGGVLLRRLVHPAMLAPLLLGLLVTRVSVALGIQDSRVVLALLTSALTVVSLVLLTVTAIPLNRAHAALEASRERTQHLVEKAPDGIFVADLSGRYTDVNDAGCRLLGFTREEIIGKTIVELIPPEDVDRLAQSRDRMLEGASQVDEWMLRRKDGSYVPVEVSASILADGRWQGFVRDISERKRLENELRQSEAKATGIVSISADAIISIDEQQRITLFNEGAERIFGWSRAEAIGAPLEILFPERFREAHRQHVARFATGPEVARRMGRREAPIVGLRKTGEEFPADAAISKLEVAGTRVLTVVARDITEQKDIENEQRFLAEVGPALATTLDHEETLSRIAELAVRDLADLCIVDLVDDAGGEVRRMRVVSRDPSLAALCEELQRAPLVRARADLVRSALETRQPVLVQRLSREDLDALLQHDDRAVPRALELQSGMAIPLLAHGRLLGVIALLSATPARIYGAKHQRLALELAQRAALAVDNARLYLAAQHAIRLRDEVLGVVAHDLRNPLGVILLHAELLRRRLPEPERKPSETIKRAATRMNRLIQDLLDVARIEADRLTLEPDRLSTAAVVTDAVETQAPEAASRSLELRLELPQDLPDVWADRHPLFRVFENLISNAVKFTAPGGCVTVGAAAREAEVVFWVRDTGAGIPAEDQAHVFDRFWQARESDRRGAGMGLAIVKGIVEAHRGRIWLESSPGRGSTFFFTIPTAPRTEAGETEAAPPTSTFVGTRVRKGVS